MIQFLLAFQLAIIPLKGFHHEEVRDTTRPFAVIHSDETASSGAALSYLKRTHKSYHYYIKRDGRVYQLVDPRYIANHAGWSIYKGMMHWNEFAIGICFANNKRQPFTEAQYISGKKLVDSLRKIYPTLQLVTHRNISGFRGKTDPGKRFDLKRLGASNGSRP